MSQSYYPDIAVTTPVWATSFSLAATREIDVSLFSSSYLDVSVQRVCSSLDVTALRQPGCPIRISADLFVLCRSPRLFAACHVLLRLQEPRYPPYALYYFLKMSRSLLQYQRNTPISPLKTSMNSVCLYPERTLHPKFRPPVEDKGLEPLTPCVQGRCSSQLS